MPVVVLDLEIELGKGEQLSIAGIFVLLVGCLFGRLLEHVLHEVDGIGLLLNLLNGL